MRRFRMVPLRVRILATLLALLAFGLTIAGAATYTALRDFRVQHTDRLLNAVGRQVEQELARQTTPDLEAIFGPEGNGVTRLWRAGAGEGELPTFFQLRGTGGTVRQTVTLGETPPRPLTGYIPRPPRPLEGPGSVDFRRVEADDVGPPWVDADWRVRVTRLVSGDVLVIGMPATKSDEVIGRIFGTQVLVTLAVLGVVGLVAIRAVRRLTRPLEEIGATAAAIGDGDLSRRLAQADDRSEVGRLGLALNTMLGQIESAFRDRETSQARLRRFIADASHELRTPVATIRGYAELFRRGAADRPQDLAKAMRRIESEAERMGVLVDEMLLLARLDQGRPLERAEVDLAELAADAVADARAVDPDRPLFLDADEPVLVCGDAVRLRQALANLVANVRQHTPAGAPAAVRVERTARHAVIEVTDSGPGLAEGLHAKVFERFYRADSARTRDHGGAGLGLSIVAAVAEAHQGEASAHPVEPPGHGTTFRVRLPLPPPEEQAGPDTSG